MNSGAWGALALIGAALYLNTYGEAGRFASAVKVLRFLGLATVVVSKWEGNFRTEPLPLEVVEGEGPIGGAGALQSTEHI